MSHMSELSVQQQNEEKELNIKDLEVIFDVLNVFTPSDIAHVYPEMGTDEFMKDVNCTWAKVLDIIKQEDRNKGYKKLKESAKILFDNP